MEAVLVSPKFQVVIPIRPTREMRGFLKGIDTTVEREPDRL